VFKLTAITALHRRLNFIQQFKDICMFTLILTLVVLAPGCSGPNCMGYSSITTVTGFESFGLCDLAGSNWEKTMKQPASAKYVCVQLNQPKS